MEALDWKEKMLEDLKALRHPWTQPMLLMMDHTHDVVLAVELAAVEKMEVAYFDLQVFQVQSPMHFDVSSDLGQPSGDRLAHSLAVDYSKVGLKVFVDVRRTMG